MDDAECIVNFEIWGLVSSDDAESVRAYFARSEKDHLWHTGEGIVFTVKGETSTVDKHISGYLRFAENVEDEWFLVHTLVDLSRLNTSFIIRVWDADGDFLLVEAADFLPRWANPETTENRVFIHQGKVHLIPIAHDIDPLPKGTPSVMEAVNAVRNYPEITVASPEIQEAVLERIKVFPEALNKNLHRCNCYLPANAAALLKSYPTMVAPAVIAFCHKDEDDIKACRAMRFFPPETRVMSSVLMTRHHYAMLTSINYIPDKRTGWSLPSTTDPKWKAYDLGLKIACGLEILLAHTNQTHSGSQTPDLAESPKWDKYVKSLAEKGYFQGYMDGSKPYKTLLEKAKVFFEASVTENSEEFQASYKHHMGRQVQGLLKQLDVDFDALRSQERSLQPSDDDSWLNVTPDQLDALMAEKVKRGVPGSQDPFEELAAFMEKVSSYEGVELGNGKPPIPPARRKSSSLRKSSLLAPPSRKVSSQSVGSTASNISMLTDKMGFDADGFAAAMQNILDFSVPEDDRFDSSDDDNSSGLSDYGSEPEMDFNLPTGAELPSVKDLIYEMERELVESGVMQGREEVITQLREKESGVVDSDDDDDFRPVSVDASALSGLLESYRSQHGVPGPSSSLLGALGVPLEKLSSEKRES